MKLTFGLAVLLATAGCSSLRWGSKAPEGGAAERVLRDSSASEGLHPPPPAASPGDAPHSPRPRAARSPQGELLVPPSTPEQLKTAIFYSDLGPDELDVSSFPAQQRYNYKIYASVCSSCHGLARSINAPVASRGWWEFYVMSMRVRGRLAGAPLSKDDVKAVLDFLEYDGKERKLGRFTEFEAHSAELRRRFDRLVDQRVERLQKTPAPRRLRE